MFSLGSVIWFVLTGNSPFSRDNLRQLLPAKVESFVSSSISNSRFSDGFTNLLEKIWKKNPESRSMTHELMSMDFFNPNIYGIEFLSKTSLTKVDIKWPQVRAIKQKSFIRSVF